MHRSLLAPRAPVWLWSTIAVGAVSVVLYDVSSSLWSWQPGRIGGLTFGVLAALLFLNAGLYPWRRRWRARPLGTAQRWLHLHVYGSALAMLFVLLHMGPRWPAGTMGWLLLVLSAWTTVTGFAGMWLQRLIPFLLASRLSVEAIYERIPDLVKGLAAEADALMKDAPDVFARAYSTEIRPLLAEPQVSVAWLTGSSPAREALLRPLANLRPFLDAGDRARLEDLEAILQDKVDLDAQMSLQRILRTWLVIHVPAAMLLLGLLAVHIAAVVWH
jgi:hypothetical protein